MPPPRSPVTFTTIRPPAASVTLDLTPMSFGTTDAASYAQAFPLQSSHEFPDYQGTKSRPIRIPTTEIYEDDPKLAQAIQDRLQILKSDDGRFFLIADDLKLAFDTERLVRRKPISQEHRHDDCAADRK